MARTCRRQDYSGPLQPPRTVQPDLDGEGDLPGRIRVGTLVCHCRSRQVPRRGGPGFISGRGQGFLVHDGYTRVMAILSANALNMITDPAGETIARRFVHHPAGGQEHACWRVAHDRTQGPRDHPRHPAPAARGGPGKDGVLEIYLSTEDLPGPEIPNGVTSRRGPISNKTLNELDGGPKAAVPAAIPARAVESRPSSARTTTRIIFRRNNNLREMVRRTANYRTWSPTRPNPVAPLLMRQNCD